MNRILPSILLALACAVTAWAGVPNLINYQGRLLDAVGQPIEGNVPASIAVFDAEKLGSMIYTQDLGTVSVQNGLFSFQWGDTAMATALTNGACWLEVTMNGETMTPRQQLVAVPYALRADEADRLADGQTALRLVPQAIETITNAPAPAGTMRMDTSGQLLVNTNGQVNGWIAMGGRASSYGELLILPSLLAVTNASGESTTATIVATNSGVSAFDYHVNTTYSDGSGWLTIEPAAKVLAVGASFAHTLTVDADGLVPGLYAATLQFNGNQWNGPQTTEVVLDVRAMVTNDIDHDTTAEFATGSFTGVEDIGSGATPQLRIAYDLPVGFGDGRDGSATIGGDPNTRASCSGAAGQNTLTSSLIVNAGDVIMMHQTVGTGVGGWEFNRVVNKNGSTITLENDLNNTYTDGGGSQAQALRVPQYSDLTISGGGPSAWNGDLGGVYAVLCDGLITVSGNLSASGAGFRGGVLGRYGSHCNGQQGESTGGAGSYTLSANATGGGGGAVDRCHGANIGHQGGGGGHGSAGQKGDRSDKPGGYGGAEIGDPTLSTMHFGGAGGGGGEDDNIRPGYGSQGGNGGGIIVLVGREVVVAGSVNADGAVGGNSTDGCVGGGGGGAGGSILIQSAQPTLGSGKVLAEGKIGGTGGDERRGTGGHGRIRVLHDAVVAWTTSPSTSNGDLLFLTSGTYRSPALALQYPRSMGKMHWSFAGGTSVRVRTRSADTEAGLDAAPWSGYLDVSGADIQTAARPWFQYEVELQGQSQNPPTLTDVQFDYIGLNLP